MPKIILKYKSPEFVDETEKINIHNCEMPGCPISGSHKAPKHRGLDEYYHFCENHIKEYNKAWDFFSGMSEREVNDHVRKSIYGDRPTWKHNENGKAEEAIYRAAQNTYHYGNEGEGKQENQEQNNKRQFRGDTSTPEHEAMAFMGLAPPVTLDEIKTRYKTLAKKHHPDLNRSDPNAEELLKKINMAYTILKLAFEEYKNLPDH